ncbi:hypothetical protein F511_25764 [Dorcoceras hygrometricum]|uniref:Uncharacterized protein n=1 Tax=Dorcoceras hygrometricum TaxID=472368 RepID=A0A2Z7BR56_9LAMI|nr:hypothetical protein F511_25764 [Dorcoceras hygrometricum]
MGCPGQARTKPRSKIFSRRNHLPEIVAGRRPPPLFHVRHSTTRWLCVARPGRAQPPSSSAQQRASSGRSSCAIVRQPTSKWSASIREAGGQLSASISATSAQINTARRPLLSASTRDMRNQVRARHANGEGAAASLRYNLKFEILDTFMAKIVLKDPSLCFDTTVGKAVADPDPVSRRRSGSLKFKRRDTRLAPTSFTRKPAIQTVGGGRLRLIKSTTGSKVPSSACTRRPDEISTDGNSSSRWPEQVRRGKAAAAWWPTAAAASEEREAAEWVL